MSNYPGHNLPAVDADGDFLRKQFARLSDFFFSFFSPFFFFMHSGENSRERCRRKLSLLGCEQEESHSGRRTTVSLRVIECKRSPSTWHCVSAKRNWEVEATFNSFSGIFCYLIAFAKGEQIHSEMENRILDPIFPRRLAARNSSLTLWTRLYNRTLYLNLANNKTFYYFIICKLLIIIITQIWCNII